MRTFTLYVDTYFKFSSTFHKFIEMKTACYSALNTFVWLILPIKFIKIIEMVRMDGEILLQMLHIGGSN